MKHRIKKRTLSRNAPHRRAMFKNMTASLIAHGSVVTTEAKARELVSYVEPLFNVGAKELTLSRRRYLLQRLGQKSDLAPLVERSKAGSKRNSGWLRLTKLPRRKSDGAPLMRVDIIDIS